MNLAPEITESQVRDNICRAMATVFKTMLRRPAQLRPDGADGAGSGAPTRQIVGIVGFVGQANGIIHLCFTESFAKQGTGSMLGLTELEVDEMGTEPVADAVGELTNMVVGAFKNDLCDAGFSCTLTIPSTIIGTDITIAPAQSGMVRRHAYRFESLGEHVAADIMIKDSRAALP